MTTTTESVSDDVKSQPYDRTEPVPWTDLPECPESTVTRSEWTREASIPNPYHGMTRPPREVSEWKRRGEWDDWTYGPETIKVSIERVEYDTGETRLKVRLSCSDFARSNSATNHLGRSIEVRGDDIDDVFDIDPRDIANDHVGTIEIAAYRWAYAALEEAFVEEVEKDAESIEYQRLEQAVEAFEEDAALAWNSSLDEDNDGSDLKWSRRDAREDEKQGRFKVYECDLVAEGWLDAPATVHDKTTLTLQLNADHDAVAVYTDGDTGVVSNNEVVWDGDNMDEKKSELVGWAFEHAAAFLHAVQTLKGMGLTYIDWHADTSAITEPSFRARPGQYQSTDATIYIPFGEMMVKAKVMKMLKNEDGGYEVRVCFASVVDYRDADWLREMEEHLSDMRLEYKVTDTIDEVLDTASRFIDAAWERLSLGEAVMDGLLVEYGAEDRLRENGWVRGIGGTFTKVVEHTFPGNERYYTGVKPGTRHRETLTLTVRPNRGMPFDVMGDAVLTKNGAALVNYANGIYSYRDNVWRRLDREADERDEEKPSGAGRFTLGFDALTNDLEAYLSEHGISETDEQREARLAYEAAKQAAADAAEAAAKAADAAKAAGVDLGLY